MTPEDAERIRREIEDAIRLSELEVRTQFNTYRALMEGALAEVFTGKGAARVVGHVLPRGVDCRAPREQKRWSRAAAKMLHNATAGSGRRAAIARNALLAIAERADELALGI